ncbi:helix-turn-helix transcriptional regulator [Actinomycetospora straminea]|uniref:Helix-turn-helix transcriptional regulator n=1 Tax=Actinomycetospora straminea TaxID=663607 RepID=A0ABP9FBA6_9PSEU
MSGRGRDERGPWPAPLGASSSGSSSSAVPPLPAWADEDTPVFVISVAAQIAGMHAQTLRSYDRIGLVTPGRASGGGRRYSVRDIAVLREVQRLSQEDGVNLAGIKRIIELEREVGALTDRLAEVTEELARWRAAAEQAAQNATQNPSAGDRLPARRTQSVVVWQPGPRRRE